MSKACSYCEDENCYRRTNGDVIMISQNKTWSILALASIQAIHRESGCVDFCNREAWNELKKLIREARERVCAQDMFSKFK